MFTSILVAYDGSDHAKSALAMGAGLAKIHAAELHLAHVPQVDTPPIVIGSYVGPMYNDPTAAQIKQAGDAIVEQAKAEADALGVQISHVHLGVSDPAQVILDGVETSKADLIVMGRRGLGALSALALGSVSLRVAHKATCPCLTVT